MMKIKQIFNASRKHFEEGGRLSGLKPIFNAMETFFFIPGTMIQREPFVRDSIDLKRFMTIAIIALLPSFFFGIYNTGFQANLAAGLSIEFIPVVLCGLSVVLPIVAVSYLVGFFWEIMFASIRKHPISEGFLVTGLIFPLTLPPNIPLWQVAVGISFGVVIGKEVFGGTGRNIFNPALTGRAFLFFAYPSSMSGDSPWIAHVGQKASEAVVNAFTAATPLACNAQAPPFDTIKTVLDKAGYNFSTLFTGLYPGSIGGTSALCCLLGALFLIVLGIGSYRIILGGIIGVLGTGLLLNFLASPDKSSWFSLNPCYHLVMGGFAYGIAFMATDPVTAPGMNKAKWIYGVAIGALTVMIRVLNPAFPEGVMMAILFMNLFSPLMDYIEIQLALRKRIPNV